MSVYKVSAIVVGSLALGSSAALAQASTGNMRYFVQDATSPTGTPENAPPMGVIGDVKKTEATETTSAELAEAPTSEEEGVEDPNSSDSIRTKWTHSVEFFTDYSTFVTDQQDFSPLAYGLKYSRFLDSDLKVGASVAVEQFQWNDDESDVVPGAPAGERLRERNIDVEGTAVRFGAHAQYFVENSMNAQLQLFGSSGKTEKENGMDAQYYGRTGLSLSLGNQWSWEDFTISWNWLSLTYNFSAKVGGTNLLTKYPSNRTGGMVLLSGLGFGAEW